MSATQTAHPRSIDDERRTLLASQVARLVGKGWRVEAQNDFQATLVKGHRPNHLLHLILTLLTLGLWAIVWIIVAVVSGEKRRVVMV